MRQISILIINPNTTVSMTEALKPVIENLGYADTSYTYLTAPTGVPSINNAADAATSAEHVLRHLDADSGAGLRAHDAVLIACYSEHPLVAALRARTRAPVLGIFEASVTASLQLLDGHERFAIVSTGVVWQRLLDEGVTRILGAQSSRFASVATTGLDADALHAAPAALVQERIQEAVRSLLRRGEGNIRAICLGCAGMAGMDALVRAACVAELGAELGNAVWIVDGVKAGVGALQALVRARFRD